MKIIMEMTEEQALLLSWGSEMMARLMMGQFDTLKEICHRKHIEPDYEVFEQIRLQLMDQFSPDLVKKHGHSASWGIHSPEIPDRARTFWDMYHCIDSTITWKRFPISSMTIGHQSVMKTGPLDLIKVEYVDHMEGIYRSFFRRNSGAVKQMASEMGYLSDKKKLDDWIDRCKAFARYEYEYNMKNCAPIPEEEYLKFFNERKEDGYLYWDETTGLDQ